MQRLLSGATSGLLNALPVLGSILGNWGVTLIPAGEGQATWATSGVRAEKERERLSCLSLPVQRASHSLLVQLFFFSFSHSIIPFPCYCHFSFPKRIKGLPCKLHSWVADGGRSPKVFSSGGCKIHTHSRACPWPSELEEHLHVCHR